ncbi:glycosyltransferase [Arcticibacter eurypsychrophilus]|uniref:glycosyltransferase n=1 Tax=Arcticibacter eurypsychrophilus TaxID=1434752 RepID=UPI001FE0A1BD|nr:glycosyltransferase family 2 protein [Arcticibacter eurypsychrophilus]
MSILIPARNEEGRIESLLQSISDQSYQNLEVLILDDQSTDATFNICTAYAQQDDRFKVFKGNKLPEGWLGKNYACHQLGKLAEGKYFLFIDADTQIKEGLINSVIHRMKAGKLALLSLFTNQIMGSIGERMVVPLMHFILLNLLPLRLVRISKNPAFAAASGQFMLFDSALYHHHSWHAQVKDKVLEDIELIKLIKTYRYNAEALLANGYISCRMYKSYEEGVNGFSKNLLAGFNKNIGGLICYLMLVMIGPLFIASYLPVSLFMFAMTLIILSRIMISLLSGQHVLWNVLLHPFQMATLLFIAILSVQKYLSKTITWKGRAIKQ